MKPSWTSIRGVAGTALLVCTVAFARSNHSTPVKTQPTAKKSRTAKPRTASTERASRRGKRSSKSWRRGQQKVDPARARQIQEALIRQHYLNGNASGKWDPATEDAMRRYQADSGWQDKKVPDSRALIKLGLGPNHDHLLNPESAMTTTPAPPPTTPVPAHTAVPAGDREGSANQPQP